MLQCLGVGAEQSVSLNSLLVITISLHCCIGHSIFFPNSAIPKKNFVFKIFEEVFKCKLSLSFREKIWRQRREISSVWSLAGPSDPNTEIVIII